jgi:hypothetical protein
MLKPASRRHEACFLKKISHMLADLIIDSAVALITVYTAACFDFADPLRIAEIDMDKPNHIFVNHQQGRSLCQAMLDSGAAHHNQ